ncbi:MAG: hypothetical protein ABIF89_02050 [bacterium]
MNKKIIIIISVIIVLCLGIVAFFLMKKESLTPEELKEVLIEQAAPSESGPDVLIVDKSEQEGLYGNPRYEIQYQEPFDLFLISILAKPIEEVRIEAENALLEKAEGNLEALCQFNVMISSPSFITEGQVIENPGKLNICSDK